MGDHWLDEYGTFRNDHGAYYSYDRSYEAQIEQLKRSTERERLLREKMLKYGQPPPVVLDNNNVVQEYAAKDAEAIQKIMENMASKTLPLSASPSIDGMGLRERLLPSGDERVVYLASILRASGVNLSNGPSTYLARLALAAMQKYYEDKTS